MKKINTFISHVRKQMILENYDSTGEEQFDF